MAGTLALLDGEADKNSLVSTIYSAMKEILGNPTDAFFSGRVMDLLFDGIVVDCSSNAVFVTVICGGLIGTNAARTIDGNQTHLAFSMLAGVS